MADRLTQETLRSVLGVLDLLWSMPGILNFFQHLVTLLVTGYVD